MYIIKTTLKRSLKEINKLFLVPQPKHNAKSLQSCPTLCDPIDGSPPGSPIPGILQARTLEWVAISFSNAWKWKVKVKSFSRVQLLATPWTAAYQAPPSMGFSSKSPGVGCHCLLHAYTLTGLISVQFWIHYYRLCFLITTMLWIVHTVIIVLKFS